MAEHAVRSLSISPDPTAPTPTRLTIASSSFQAPAPADRAVMTSTSAIERMVQPGPLSSLGFNSAREELGALPSSPAEKVTQAVGEFPPAFFG